MTEMTVRLNTIDDVKNFVSVLNRYEFDCDINAGKYVVDAKSIMGLFSLDLSKALTLKLHTDDIGDLTQRIEQYIVK